MYNINELNNTYKSALAQINGICQWLDTNKLKYKTGFYNKHLVKINGTFVNELFPIPVVSFKLNNISFDVGIDVASDSENIGFIELTLSKNNILNFDFKKLKNCKFDIYGVKNCLNDYHFGNINQTLKTISQSKEKSFHIGINIYSIDQIIDTIKTFI